MSAMRIKRKIVIGEAAGFAAIVALLWVNELADLPHVLFKTAATPINWAECLMESLVVAILAVIVVAGSWRLLRRVRYLEGFLPVCRFCRRIRVAGEWVPLAQYMAEQPEEAMPEGACPDCAARLALVEQALETE